MIEINRHTLNNGLRIVHSRDAGTQMAAVNILYCVGSKYENPELTGLAHLFEHLMFGGSVNIPYFDAPLQAAGGECNAWTSEDLTNYYEQVPLHNIETAFWLESDRMRSLAFTSESLETQRSVVIEEFKQRYLNQPYGDLEQCLKNAAYKEHPYKWSVIGKDISHIEKVTMPQVKDFFFSNYSPANAILSVVGDMSFEDVIKLSEKWFGKIERRNLQQREIKVEPQKENDEIVRVTKDVPQNIIYKGYRMCERSHQDYQASDILSDILANGNSSRFFQNVVLQGKLFSELDASIWGTIDPGLMVIKGTLLPGVSYEDGENLIQKEISSLFQNPPTTHELEKCINKFESKELFGNISILDRAYKMAYYEYLGDACGINQEVSKYRSLTIDKVMDVARKIFIDNKCTTLYYGPNA